MGEIAKPRPGGACFLAVSHLEIRKVSREAVAKLRKFVQIFVYILKISNFKADHTR
jgi:hypothetical protein